MHGCSMGVAKLGADTIYCASACLRGCYTQACPHGRHGHAVFPGWLFVLTVKYV